MIRSALLSDLPDLRHGFFTRLGGVSKGLYAGLNCGLGSRDERERVIQNRAYVAGCLGIAAHRLVTVYQVQSPHCVVVEQPFAQSEVQRADAMVTTERGLALGVSSADCTPILFAANGVIGAAHAGWRGALAGVVEATLAGMVALGAKSAEIQAAIGPTISQANYEVGPEVVQAFSQQAPDFAKFFIPSPHQDKWLFDLPGLVAYRLRAAGIGKVDELGLCTYGDDKRFFSYRRMTHRGEADYGRHIHAIALNSA